MFLAGQHLLNFNSTGPFMPCNLAGCHLDVWKSAWAQVFNKLAAQVHIDSHLEYDRYNTMDIHMYHACVPGPIPNPMPQRDVLNVQRVTCMQALFCANKVLRATFLEHDEWHIPTRSVLFLRRSKGSEQSTARARFMSDEANE